ncbi:MAG: hypothetical protein IAF58_08140 [Leptolyngbya sp.]|nr:hypothetical protein [Candidatus Melainabacteria bacterium]
MPSGSLEIERFSLILFIEYYTFIPSKTGETEAVIESVGFGQKKTIYVERE